MICIPITAKTTGAALTMIKTAASLADLIELRVDGMRDIDMGRLLKNRPRPMIVTNRRRDEGGAFTGTEHERTAVLAQAARLGVEYIDVEIATAPTQKRNLQHLAAESGTQIIASWHDVQGTPTATVLKAKLKEGMADTPAIVKLVTRAQNESDNLRLLAIIPLAKTKGQTIIAFCMGDQGRISRVMAPLVGSRISYAPLAETQSSAPGQLTAARMRKILSLLADLAPTVTGNPGSPPAGERSPERRSSKRE